MEQVAPVGCGVFVLEIQNPSGCSPGQPGLADGPGPLQRCHTTSMVLWFCGRVLSRFDTWVPVQLTCMINLYKCRLTWLTLG